MVTGELMDIKQRLKALLQEAETYRTQGLVTEANAKYKDAADLINSIANLKNRESLLSAIANKISGLDSSKEKTQKTTATPELSSKAQDLIKNLFAFSDNREEEGAALEGAVALAKFGQFDRAIVELTELLKKEAVRVEAAKNILRCHLTAASPEEAVNQYRQWVGADLFPPDQLETVRAYLEEILQQRGVTADLPSPLVTAAAVETQSEDSIHEVEAESETEEELMDITSIGITFDAGPRKGRSVEFDVNFQSGNTLSLIISKQESELIESLSTGMKLKDVQFFSPIAIFNGSGVVTSKTQIKSGPKHGDYCLDIRIVSS
jgi:tetratricopeptide (TPR) repeat protein